MGELARVLGAEWEHEDDEDDEYTEREFTQLPSLCWDGCRYATTAECAWMAGEGAQAIPGMVIAHRKLTTQRQPLEKVIKCPKFKQGSLVISRERLEKRQEAEGKMKTMATARAAIPKEKLAELYADKLTQSAIAEQYNLPVWAIGSLGREYNLEAPRNSRRKKVEQPAPVEKIGSTTEKKTEPTEPTEPAKPAPAATMDAVRREIMGNMAAVVEMVNGALEKATTAHAKELSQITGQVHEIRENTENQKARLLELATLTRRINEIEENTEQRLETMEGILNQHRHQVGAGHWSGRSEV